MSAKLRMGGKLAVTGPLNEVIKNGIWEFVDGEVTQAWKRIEWT